jgi:hypothetical protein
VFYCGFGFGLVLLKIDEIECFFSSLDINVGAQCVLLCGTRKISRE